MRVSLTESTPILILKPPDSEAAEGDEAAPSWQCWAELNCINESWLWEGLVIAHFSKVRAEARPSLRSGQTRRSRAHVVTARLGQLVWRCRTLYLREQNLPALGCAMNSSGCDESTHHCKVESPCRKTSPDQVQELPNQKSPTRKRHEPQSTCHESDGARTSHLQFSAAFTAHNLTRHTHTRRKEQCHQSSAPEQRPQRQHPAMRCDVNSFEGLCRNFSPQWAPPGPAGSKRSQTHGSGWWPDQSCHAKGTLPHWLSRRDGK